MANSRFTHVLFDAGGTLLGTNTTSEFWFEQFFVDACAEQGCKVTVHDVHEVLRNALRSRHFDTRCSSDAQARQFWLHIYHAAFSDLLGAKAMTLHTPAYIDHLAADYIDRFQDGEFVRLFPDALQALEDVRAKGVKMGIVSNFSTYLVDFLGKLEIDHFFDFVLTSAAEGCEKPGGDIYRLAISQCDGSTPEQIMYVGDSPDEDYRPALRHGMYPLLIDRHNRHAAQDDLTRINSLSQICQYLT